MLEASSKNGQKMISGKSIIIIIKIMILILNDQYGLIFIHEIIIYRQ